MAKGRKTGGRKPIVITPTHKQCSRCKKMKERSDFPTSPNAPHGLYPKCKACHAGLQRERLKSPPIRRKKNAADKALYYKAKPKWRNRRYYKEYGIGLATYTKMFDIQNGKCKICETPQEELTRQLAIDHCHATGKIRGLLCGLCNTGLGAFRDNKTLLQIAISYLGENHES